MNGGCVTKATLGRLPQYLRYLKSLPQGETISAAAIARGLSLGEVQVRKDLAAVSGEGRPRVGYIMSELICDIEEKLGCDHLTPAILVGTGALGRALMAYDGFEEYGLRIAAAFDAGRSVLHTGRGAREILPVDMLEDFCAHDNVRIGIITTGQGSAQQVCDLMVKSGITAIWNFAPCALRVPEGVLLKQENLALSLAHLSSQLRQA